jgi:hypothetical protein
MRTVCVTLAAFAFLAASGGPGRTEPMWFFHAGDWDDSLAISECVLKFENIALFIKNKLNISGAVITYNSRAVQLSNLNGIEVYFLCSDQHRKYVVVGHGDDSVANWAEFGHVETQINKKFSQEFGEEFVN